MLPAPEVKAPGSIKVTISGRSCDAILSATWTPFPDQRSAYVNVSDKKTFTQSASATTRLTLDQSSWDFQLNPTLGLTMVLWQPVQGMHRITFEVLIYSTSNVSKLGAGYLTVSMPCQILETPLKITSIAGISGSDKPIATPTTAQQRAVFPFPKKEIDKVKKMAG
jgi:hypothetical protein